MRTGLNDFAISQGHLTLDTFKQLLESQFSAFDTRVQATIRQGGPFGNDDASAAATSGPDERVPQRELYSWGGKLHMVPEDFDLPKVPVSQAFILWTCGNLEKKYPAFRLLSPQDMPTPNLRKRFSDLKNFMEVLEKRAKSANDPCWPRMQRGLAWKDSLTLVEARAAFDKVATVIAIPSKTGKGRDRRVEQMAWTSHFKEWKASKKYVDNDDESAGGNDSDHGVRLPISKRTTRGSLSSAAPSGSSMAVSDDDEELPAVTAANKLDGDGFIGRAPDVDADNFAPDVDVLAAYRLLVDYCDAELQLTENVTVPGDGSCLFHVASVQLQLARPELGLLPHERIREACVAWVYATYSHTEADVLESAGYLSWDDWRLKMSNVSRYGDELCVEALAAVYRVRILCIFSRHQVNHRHIGEEGLPEIFIGCVGDHHFYSFGREASAARRENPKRTKWLKSLKRRRRTSKGGSEPY